MENRKGAVTKIAKTLFSLFSNEVRFKGVNLTPKEKTCYTRTSPNFNFLVFFEFLIEFLVGFPD